MRKSWEIRATHENLDQMGWPHDCDEFDRAELAALLRERKEIASNVFDWPLSLGWNYPNKWN